MTFDPVEAAILKRAKSDASVNAVLQNDLHAALAAIDGRKYAACRDVLRVNQPSHAPSPRVFVPSRAQRRESDR